jgi:hypothetical protein
VSRLKQGVLIFLFASITASALADGVPKATRLSTKRSAGANLCALDEKTFFACTTSRRRVIAVCGVSPNDIQYRIGSSTRKIELFFPNESGNGAKQFLYSHYSRHQTERFELSFKNQGVRYSVFDYVENGKQSAGVNIEALDGKESTLRCLKAPQSELHALEKSVPCNPDSALNHGRCTTR